eukprot:CAMPEP_0197492538 /NCGR_PEP_ID=MMETSP1311-20131121/10670_1 /TAXON_ID=464262 /ORGANISM="Genus nov. species nov., Strain RCC856" /LENGTH=122 /DNA_ID=CAMNT_0043037505 /DNA_START=1 /DNA_END=369 /DNA_ORIENTATION=+
MTTLYEDDFVCLTDEGIEIKWYYFPTTISKKIQWDEVKCFRLEPVNLFTSKGWGMGFSNVWWACDTLRQFSCDQAKFLSVSTVEGCCRKGFSCRNLMKVKDIMDKYAGIMRAAEAQQSTRKR